MRSRIVSGSLPRMVQQLTAGEPIRGAVQSAGDIHSRRFGAKSPLKAALRCVACFTPKRTVPALRRPSGRVCGALRDQVLPEGGIVEMWSAAVVACRPRRMLGTGPPTRDRALLAELMGATLSIHCIVASWA